MNNAGRKEIYCATRNAIALRRPIRDNKPPVKLFRWNEDPKIFLGNKFLGGVGISGIPNVQLEESHVK